MAQEKTYQPGWGEEPKKHRHHHHHSHSRERDRGLGGALRMRDRQAYYGLIILVAVIALYGFYRLGRIAYRELREMPFDDPASEMNVDELRIRKVAEQDALLYADSLKQAYDLDSIQRQVQIETVPVYRPPKRENTWYITRRDWRSIKRNYKVWRWAKKREEQEQKE